MDVVNWNAVQAPDDGRTGPIKEIVFHIGSVKTGSTFLQKTFWEHRDAFNSVGLHYLCVTPPEVHLPRYANAEFLYAPEQIDKAIQLINEAPASQVLISEEGLMARPELLDAPPLRVFRRRVIVYLRRPAELILAWAAEKSLPYNTRTDLIHDQAGLLGISEGIKVTSVWYTGLLRQLDQVADLLGDGNIIVRPYEHDQFLNGNLLDDFLGAIGIAPDGAEISQIRSAEEVVNKGRNRKYCDISEFVWNRLRGTENEREFDMHLVDEIDARCQSGDGRPPIETASDRLIEELSEQFKPLENHISQRFLDGKPLFRRRFPDIYGTARSKHSPVSTLEVELLLSSALLARQFGAEKQRLLAV